MGLSPNPYSTGCDILWVYCFPIEGMIQIYLQGIPPAPQTDVALLHGMVASFGGVEAITRVALSTSRLVNRVEFSP